MTHVPIVRRTFHIINCQIILCFSDLSKAIFTVRHSHPKCTLKRNIYNSHYADHSKAIQGHKRHRASTHCNWRHQRYRDRHQSYRDRHQIYRDRHHSYKGDHLEMTAC